MTDEKKVTEAEKLLYSLSAIKDILKMLECDVEVTMTLKNGHTETFDCYKEIEKCVVNFIKNTKQYKWEDLKVGMWIRDDKPDFEEFTFIKITKILSESACEYFYHDKNKKIFFDNMVCHAREWEENRFFPVIANMR